MTIHRSSSAGPRARVRLQRVAGADAAGRDAASSPRRNGVPLTVPAIGVGCGLVLAFLALYVRTAARSIVVGDNPELITTAVVLGVAHPSGYPLLVLLGHLFSLLPVGPVAFRVNLLATVCGAGTVGLVYLTAWRLTRSWLPAAVAAVALGVNPLFWSWSLAFEAFCLNNLIAAAVIYLLALWQEQGRYSHLMAVAFLGGLGAANHQTIVLLAPVALFLSWRPLLHRPRLLLACIAAVALGLLPYAYIPWAAARHPFLSWGDVGSVSDLIALATRADYGIGTLVSAEKFSGGSWLARVTALAKSFLPVEGPLLLVGGVEIYRRSRAYFWLFLLAFIVTGPAFVAYANMNLSTEGALFTLERFFLLSHVVTAPVTGVGIVALRRLVIPVAGRRLGYATLGACAAVTLVVPAVFAYSAIDQSHNYLAEHYAEDVLASVPRGALLLATGDEHCFPLAFVQAVEGRRPDVTLVLPGLLPAAWYRRQLQARVPDLHLRPDPESGRVTVKSVIEANRSRPVAMVGPIDKSLANSYGPVLLGLTAWPSPAGERINLVDIVEKNEALLKRYRIPRAESINRHTYELFLLQAYARPVEWVATLYQQFGHDQDAAAWHQRALAIDPEYPGAKEGYAQVTAR